MIFVSVLVLGDISTPCENIQKLKGAFGQQGVVFSLEQITELSQSGYLPEHTVVCIAGEFSGQSLIDLCHLLRSRWNIVIVIRDATNFEELISTIHLLTEERVEILTTTGALSTIEALHRGVAAVYAFSKADVTASIVVLFGCGKYAAVIRRDRAPFEGWLACAGGFFTPFLDAEVIDCAVRELGEESGLLVEREQLLELKLRAEKRDPRHAILNYGFVYWVDPKNEERERRRIHASDDARSIEILPVETLLQGDKLAFDHADLLRQSLTTRPPWLSWFGRLCWTLKRSLRLR